MRSPETEIDVDASSSDDQLMSLGAVLEFFGGDRPIHFSTLYRGIANGRYPKPIPIGPNTKRWLRSECREARQRMIDARDGRVPNASGAPVASSAQDAPEP